MAKNYHCCATCEHFRITRTDDGPALRCARLGYATKTHYRFNCWQPRTDIRSKMEAQTKGQNRTEAASTIESTSD